MNEILDWVMVFETYFFYVVMVVMPVWAFVALYKRSKVKNVKIAINHGLLWGYPLLPVVYGVVQLICVGIALGMNDSQPVMKFLMYFLASMFWFIAAAVSEQKLVLEEGILLSIYATKKSSLLRWNRILDYFIKEKERHLDYHFFFQKQLTTEGKMACAGRCKIIIRVQKRQKHAFHAIIREKLDPKFEIDPVKIFRDEFKP
ncbi:hypothetical protein Ctha_2390 [Chloroherpeton thalassium ATCC 35110]|uniref:DUF5673 domain-containing protein n=1 Tax=Chloroherpeton thalassium (strain ATCC 35110 / GB-78) TaxID=517418 RepID=B3QX30_CHLT3|nr:hypothetical protein [Chloroherpeton thalassium]ACF14840.1 hypothetical protein Ctha_2390 [Chloroherpeton thalassium ATCC 35110]